MCGLAINFASFAHLLKRVYFDIVVNHLALTHIMKSKIEPATMRIKRLLEVLSSYSFNLYCIKGKDMILTDFLSRQRVDDSNPHEIIPISFNMRNVLRDRYYNIKNIKTKDNYLVQTRSQVKSSGVNLTEVHGGDKGIEPHVKQEKQRIKPIVTSTDIRPLVCKPRIGQGRAGLRRKVKMIAPLQQE